MTFRYDPLVFTWRAAFMQRIADYVRSGHHRWTSGEVRIERAHALVQKFVSLYRIDATRGQCQRMRKSGIAAAHIFLYSPKPTDSDQVRTLLWFLLVSDGEHPAVIIEKLRNAQIPGERMRIGGYELVQLPRKDTLKPAWTWRMTAEGYQTWRDRVVECARKPSLHAEHTIARRLYSVPGFAGIRAQVGFLVGLWRREWKRRRAAGDAFPKLPQLRYVQRLRNIGVPLSRIIREAERDAASIASSSQGKKKPDGLNAS